MSPEDFGAINLRYVFEAGFRQLASFFQSTHGHLKLFFYAWQLFQKSNQSRCPERKLPDFLFLPTQDKLVSIRTTAQFVVVFFFQPGSRFLL
jgi:hypothetical protein